MIYSHFGRTENFLSATVCALQSERYAVVASWPEIVYSNGPQKESHKK